MACGVFARMVRASHLDLLPEHLRTFDLELLRIKLIYVGAQGAEVTVKLQFLIE